MSQWKVGDGEYIPAHDMDGTTLLAKHSVPHTPTPSLSLYQLSGQGHTFVHPTTPWTFDDQRRQKHYSTTNTESTTQSDGALPYQQQIPGPGSKQLWTRQGKSSTKPPPMDYTSSSFYSTLPTTATNTTNDNDNIKNNNHVANDTNNISYTSSTAPSSSLIHPLTNIYMDLHTDGSSVRIMPSQVIPPVTLPTNQNQDHRVGSQGMVALDSQQNSMKQQQQRQYHQQQQQHQPQNQQMHQQQLTPRSEHSHYSDDRDNHHHHRATKHPYSRSFSDTPHSLLPYHHHSSQHRHNSIPSGDHAAVRAVAVAAAYQSHSMNSSQVTWYTQNSTFQKTTNPIYSHSATSSPRVAPSISKHPSDPEIYQDSNAVVDGSNFVPMTDLLSSSKMDNVDYGVHSSTTTPGTATSTNTLGPQQQQRHSNQWTSSSSASSPRISDMHSLLSMSFSPNDRYNNSKDTTNLDQQSSEEENHQATADFGNGSNSAMMTSTSNTTSDGSALHPKKQATTAKSKSKKSTQQRPQKPHTGKRRSPNAFFVFCSDRRQILKQGKPNARNTDINRQLGDDWKALTQEERDWYKQKADRIRAELPNDNTSAPPSTLNTSRLTLSDTPSITFTNDGTHSTSGHHHQPTFDLPFNDFADANSPASRTHRDSSVAMTIAVDDDSVTSDGTGSGDQHSKRGSLTNSDLSTSYSSPSSQRPLNVASLSGAAEANALDQATLAGFHSSTNSTVSGEKIERLKRPPNAYLLFNREMRRKLLDQNENLTVALISKLISQSWRDLPQDTKDGYIKEAAKLKQQHLEDHPNYVYSRRSRTELAQAGYRSRPSKKRKKMMEEADRLNADGTATNGNDMTKDTSGDNINDSEWISTSSPSTVTGTSTTATSAQQPKDGTKQQQQRRFPDPRGRKKKKHKNPLGPKHPMSGFLFFASYARPEAVRQHPKSNVGMISKVIAEQWKKMSDQEKQPWVDKAEADKARYAKEMEAFNLAQEQKEISERQQQQQQRLHHERMDGHDDNGYTNDASAVGQMKKTSISSLSSATITSFNDDQHTSEVLSLAGGSKESLDLHHRQQQHRMDYLHHRHHHHHHHHADMDRHRHHYSKYKTVSRIHSALATSRPASPTELDSHTIATVAQMVNPKNHPTPVPIPSGSTTTSNGASSSSTRDRLHLSSSFHQQHPSPSLTSIMHHHDNHSVGNLQLHVPATPPSPAIDTI